MADPKKVSNPIPPKGLGVSPPNLPKVTPPKIEEEASVELSKEETDKSLDNDTIAQENNELHQGTSLPQTTSGNISNAGEDPSLPPTSIKEGNFPKVSWDKSFDEVLMERVRAIEKRWSKSFDEVLIDLHDHIFGKSG